MESQMKIVNFFAAIMIFCVTMVNVYAQGSDDTSYSKQTNVEKLLNPRLTYNQTKESKQLEFDISSGLSWYNAAGVIGLDAGFELDWDISNDKTDFRFSTDNYFVEGGTFSVKNDGRVSIGLAAAVSITHVLNYYTWAEPGMGLGLACYWADRKAEQPKRKGSLVLSLIPSYWWIKFKSSNSLTRPDENGIIETFDLNTSVGGFSFRVLFYGFYRWDNGFYLENRIDLDLFGVVTAGRLKTAIGFPIFQKGSFSVDINLEYNMFKSSEPNESSLTITDGLYLYDISLAQENHTLSLGWVFNF